MESIHFTSTVPPRQRRSLEELLYLNANQRRVSDAIQDSIERYGHPRIIERDGLLSITLDRVAGAQVIFAQEGEALVGVVVFTRQQPDRLVVVHIAVAPAFSAGGHEAPQMLCLRLIDQVRGIGRRIRGISWVDVMYGKGQTRSVRVG